MALFHSVGGTYRFEGIAINRDLILKRIMRRIWILGFKRLHSQSTEEILSVSHRTTDECQS